jgi:hypothetical protein
MCSVDIDARTNASFLNIMPCSPEGEAWMLENVGPAYPPEHQWPVYYVEYRYGPDILLGAHNDGLTVALDGRIANAEREA